MKDIKDKIETVRKYNTFYIRDSKFEEVVDQQLSTRVKMIRSFAGKATRTRILSFMEEEPVRMFNFLCYTTGISKEFFKSLLASRHGLKPEIRRTLRIADWSDDWNENETSYTKGLKTDSAFREGIVDLFCHGHELPQFTHKWVQEKLDLQNVRDLSHCRESTLREMAKNYGSISAIKGLREENIPRKILDDLGIPYSKNVVFGGRDLDTVIETDNLVIGIENSHLNSTSSSMSTKTTDTINSVRALKRKYPDAKFYSFIDGAAWIRRMSDLKRILEVSDDAFTYHPHELRRFREVIENIWSSNMIAEAA